MSGTKRFLVSDLYVACCGDTVVVNAEDYDAALSKLAAETLRADTAEADLRTERLRADAAVGDANDAERELAAAQKRVSELLKAVEQSISWFETMSSGDGSGHKDLALAIRRMAALNPKPEAGSHEQ